VIVRPINRSDRDEWLRMRTALWPDADHSPEIDEHFQSGGTRLLAIVFVAERESGGLAGFIEIGLRPYAEGCDGEVPFIEGWYVDAGCRGSGAGGALIRAAEQWARQQGYREMASDVEIDNHVSIAAHRALGYEEVTRLVCFRRDL
jgi:aminoglycoside 6'-N-acetyltransferase I